MSTQKKNTTVQTVLPIYANELSLTYNRCVTLQDPGFIQVNSPYKVAKLLRQIWNTEQLIIRESFYLLCFSNSANLVGYYKVADGGLDAVAVDTRLLFSTALLCLASSIIIAHNHPSGSLRPSDADRDLTRRIKTGAEILGIKVNDHIILTENDFYSFNENGDL